MLHPPMPKQIAPYSMEKSNVYTIGPNKHQQVNEARWHNRVYSFVLTNHAVCAWRAFYGPALPRFIIGSRTKLQRRRVYHMMWKQCMNCGVSRDIVGGISTLLLHVCRRWLMICRTMVQRWISWNSQHVYWKCTIPCQTNITRKRVRIQVIHWCWIDKV